uniref:ERIC3 protein n=1 Tax=Macrostomum lignano TaxID=282301 RepID=A0A1I8H3D6_9PLAT
PLAQYNSLKDEHLAGYFNNRAKWRHLVKAGLITRTGEVVPEPVYRLKMARKEHKRHVRDMLAQAIVHKSLDLERKRQVDIRRKLEEIAKMEHVRRIKVRLETETGRSVIKHYFSKVNFQDSSSYSVRHTSLLEAE